MNRSQKKTLFLLAAVVVLLVAALLVIRAVKQSAQEAAAEEAAAQEETGAVTAADAAYTALSYDNGSTTLSFRLDEAGNWIWADDPEFPLDDSTVQGILALLTDLRPQQTITEGDTLEAYGLDQPFATLTATRPDGGALTVALGNTTTDGDSYYMLLDGQESPVYIISDSLYSYMSETIYDMCRLPELPALAEERIQTITVKGAVSTLLRPEDRETETDPDTGEETVTVTWSTGGEDVTGNADTASLLAEVEALRFTKCVDYKPSDEAASICGFDAPRAELSVYYETETGTEGSLKLTFGGASLDEDGCYVRMEGDPTIYQMDAAAVDTILAVAESGLSVSGGAAE